MYIHIYIHMYIHEYECIYVFMNIFVHVYIHLDVCISVCMCLYIYVCEYTHICPIYMHTYEYTHVYKYVTLCANRLAQVLILIGAVLLPLKETAATPPTPWQIKFFDDGVSKEATCGDDASHPSHAHCKDAQKPILPRRTVSVRFQRRNLPLRHADLFAGLLQHLCVCVCVCVCACGRDIARV